MDLHDYGGRAGNNPGTASLAPFVVGATLVLLPLVDAAVPRLGRSGQVIALAVALLALRRDLRPTLGNTPMTAALLAVVTLAVVAVGMGARFGSPADPAYLVRVLVLLPVWIVVGAAIGARDEQRAGFFDGVVVGAIAAAVLQFAGRVPTAGHIEVGRSIAIAIPLVVHAPVLLRSPAPRLTRFAVFGFLVAAALATGARGPVVLAIGTAVLLGVLKGSNGPDPLLGASARRLAVTVLSLCTVWVVFGTDLLRLDTNSKQLQRQQELIGATSIDDIESARIRIDDLWGPAVELIGMHPVTGTGLPASLVLVDAGNRYPHNLVLELGVAFGVTGVLFGLGIVGVIVRLAWRARHVAPLLVALSIHQLLNSMVSADIGMNRWVFLGLAGLAAHDRVRRRRTAERSVAPATART